ncbi:carboxylesterase/lipase family protein [Duganella callida]|uniref:Carboxylic ester hydrolase n=1 Tax=Duganella callida TaxID=2561932 RepID=A0A4Y9SWZ1_9BURK|nr:carboxylesterase family protein [Duganella callida]TFW29276.1 carboxylesterase [Duganella callida]
MKVTRAIGLVALCLAAASAAAESTAPVRVTGGEIAGLRAGGLNTYFGIPYAAPPVGELRWREPQPVVPWKGVRQAGSFAPACAQTAVWITETKSEDCLYLNIWAPRQADKLPVIFWIHGGGYYGGSGAQKGYDGTNLAGRGAVVVTINYRLGIFGFFAHPELTAESPVHASGNQGLLDQVAALKWVKENVAAFGGDPDRVMIVGESAGAASVAILMASPLGKGLFQSAIGESGNFAAPNSAVDSPFDSKAGGAKGLALAKSVGARDLRALRAMSVADLHKPSWKSDVVVDGYLLREDMTTTYRNHRQNDVPLLVGWNAEEGKDLAPEILGTSEFTTARHRELAARLLGYAPSSALLAAYPGATDAQAKTSIDKLTTDWWGWRMIYWADLQARYGRSPAYAYFFSHQPATPATPCGYGCGAGHGAEIRYVFDNLAQDPRAWTGTDRQLADRLATTWVNFARSGNPNGKGLPAWPRYTGDQATVLRIGGQHQLPDFALFGRE